MRRQMLKYVVPMVACGGCAIVAHTSSGPSDPALPPPGAPAVLFAPGVVSTGDVFASTFTPDGRTVVFTRFAAPKMTLMTSSFANGRWGEPTVLPFSGTYRDLDPAFSPDGRRLYFSSWRPASASPADTSNAADTWYADRTGSGWSAPVRLAEPVNSTEMDMFPSATRNGTLYFDSFRSRPRQRFVYRAERRADGSLAEPTRLDATINADSGASNLFVDPDERYVVFGAVRPEGRGAMDLYVSRRDGEHWSAPRNLGPRVNTDGTEFCPFVSRDGKYLYFTRVSPPGSARVERNVYVVRIDDLLRAP
jgi:Tol biopolymer transport system component